MKEDWGCVCVCGCPFLARPPARRLTNPASKQNPNRHTTQLATVHKAEASKDYKTVLVEEEAYLDKKQRSRDYFPRLKDPRDPAEIEGFGVPGRIFNHPLTVPMAGEGLQAPPAKAEGSK